MKVSDRSSAATSIRGRHAWLFALLGCAKAPAESQAVARLEQEDAAVVLKGPEAATLSASFDGGTTHEDAAATEGVVPEPRVRIPRAVLHIGDSTVGFRGGLSNALRRKFERAGSTYKSDAWGGVGIAQFGRSEKFRSLLRGSRADLIIVNLGMNNIDAPQPDSLKGSIRAIVENLHGVRCVWIGPPNLKADTGIVRVLKAEVAPCRFVDSRAFSIERLDGIHPTDKGGETWANDLWPELVRE